MVDITNLKTTTEAKIASLTGTETDAQLLALSKAADISGADRTALDTLLQTRITALSGTPEEKQLLALARSIDVVESGVPVGGMLPLNQDGPVVKQYGKVFLRTGKLDIDINAYPQARVVQASASMMTQTLPGIGDICEVADGYLTYHDDKVWKLDSNMDNPVELISGIGSPLSIGANSSLIYILYTGTVERYSHAGAYLGGSIDITGVTSNPRCITLTEDTMWFGASLWVHNLNLDGTNKANTLSLQNPGYTNNNLLARSMMTKDNELWVSVIGGPIIIFDFDGNELRRIDGGQSRIAAAPNDPDAENFWSAYHGSTQVDLLRYGDVVGTPYAKTDTDSGYPLFERIK